MTRPHDLCTPDGAARLKSRIEAYWSERGYQVDVSLIEMGHNVKMRSARVDVRSDMVGGMPRRRA